MNTETRAGVHTPTLHYETGVDGEKDCYFLRVTESEESPIVACLTDCAEEFAERAVVCLNSHAALVEALKDAIAELEHFAPDGKRCWPALNKARAALAAAEGGV